MLQWLGVCIAYMVFYLAVLTYLYFRHYSVFKGYMYFGLGFQVCLWAVEQVRRALGLRPRGTNFDEVDEDRDGVTATA